MGRPQFQTLTATLPSEALSFLSMTNNAEVPANTTITYTLYAPSGAIARVQTAYLAVPPPTGAAAGTHGLVVLLGNSGAQITAGFSNYTDHVIYSSGYWNTATSAQYPPAAAGMDQSYWLDKTVIDALTGIQFQYQNNTAGIVAAAAIQLDLGVVVIDLP